jgi:hypothetical protein
MNGNLRTLQGSALLGTRDVNFKAEVINQRPAYIFCNTVSLSEYMIKNNYRNL